MKKLAMFVSKRKFAYSERLMIVFFVLLFVPFFYVLCLHAGSLMSTYKNKVVEKHEQNIEWAAKEYNNFYLEVKRQFEFLNSYSELKQILKLSTPMSLMDTLEYEMSINDIFTAMLTVYDSNRPVVYHDNAHIKSSDTFHPIDELIEKEYYHDLENLSMGDIYTVIENRGGEYRLCIYSRYNNIENIYAILEISAPCRELFRKLGVVYGESCRTYFTSENSTNYLLEPTSSFESTIDITNRQSCVERIVAENCKLTCVFEKSEYWSYIIMVLVGASVATIIMCIALFFAVRFLAFYLTRRLNSIVEEITGERVEFKTPYLNRTADEFDIISDKLTDYSETIKKQNKEELEKQKKIMQMELSLLQNKISPHFLYNTLSSIKWVYSDPKLEELINSLVKYYRLVLNRGDEFIEILDEFDGLRKYLDIQSFVYAKKFGVYIECDDSVKEQRILRNLLQPIVENAFFHSINIYDAEDGFISITATRKDSDIVITVENNGILITDEDIDKIFDNQSVMDAKTSGNGYALKNIMKRIELCYGEKYGISITNNETTCVIIRIPADFEPVKEEE